MEWYVVREGQTLDYILMVEPRGFADRTVVIREKEARMMPPFLA